MPEDSKIKKLKELSELYKAGILTKEELEAEKNKILAKDKSEEENNNAPKSNKEKEEINSSDSELEDEKTQPSPVYDSNDDYDYDEEEIKEARKKKLIYGGIAFAILIGIGVFIGLYQHRQNQIAYAKEREQARLDSIAEVERLLEIHRQDSIAEVERKRKEQMLFIKKMISNGHIMTIGNIMIPSSYEDRTALQQIKNHLNCEIDGKDYSVLIRGRSNGPATDDYDGGWESFEYTKPGKNITSNGTVTYELEWYFRVEEEIVSYHWNLTDDQLIEKYGRFIINEYNE